MESTLHTPDTTQSARGAAALICFGLVLLAFPLAAQTGKSSAAADQRTVADLDRQYQEAVKRNDAAAMARFLADDFVLVTGSGKVLDKQALLQDARKGDTAWEHNDEENKTVRVWGDTAVVTARLWEKFKENGVSYDRRLWFSDTYVRTPQGWKYVFGQSSIPLPASAK